jgi:hypothetical protein
VSCRRRCPFTAPTTATDIKPAKSKKGTPWLALGDPQFDDLAGAGGGLGSASGIGEVSRDLLHVFGSRFRQNVSTKPVLTFCRLPGFASATT